MQALTGTTPDISFCLYFHFWEPVYFRVDLDEPNGKSFPSQSNERAGRWVGFGDGVGDTLTWKILTDDTNLVLYRSAVRSATSTLPNLRLSSPKGELLTATTNENKVFIRGRTNELDKAMPTIDADDLIGRTYLGPVDDDGEHHRVTIIKKIENLDEQSKERSNNIKYLIKVDDQEEADKLISYNQILEYICRDEEAQDAGDTLFRFRAITAHQGPLQNADPHYKGSKYNVLVEWETGESTYEPLSLIAQDDPVTCAVYAKKNKLLNTPGWKQFRKHIDGTARIIKTATKSKIRHTKHAVKYQYGVQIPRNYAEAVELDKQNGNTMWADAVKLELGQIKDYDTFNDVGIAQWIDGKISNAPEGYKRIRVHLVFAVKHDGRRKARLVADGHLTEKPIETIYSSVASTRSIRIVIFLAVLNGLKLWGADIGNAYLEALTKELIYILAGAEFGELEGHILVVMKALYGLRSSGARWHDRLFDILKEIGFAPSKADPDVWMRKGDGNFYEYIAVYVDDLCIAMKDPAAFCKLLKEKHQLKLKGDGPLEYHLGCSYKYDPDGTLVADPRRYVEKMLDYYEHTFHSKPKKFKTPLEAGDHPELDCSDLVGDEDARTYLTLIGQMQWLINLGRYDIASATTTLSSFRVAPRTGHLDRAKRVYGYLHHAPHGAIRFRTGEPDYSSLPDQDFDWCRSVYGDVQEQIPLDIPVPRGKFVQPTTYVDANLMHCKVTGKSLTATLHLLNGTVIDGHSKKQGTVETATYGSEFVAARVAVDQIIDIRNTLRYLGVPLRPRTYMFGDNQSVVTSSSFPQSMIAKRHHLLSYHRVREAIAARFVAFYWIDSNKNPADILSKHWDYNSVWPLIRAIFFWRGEVADSIQCQQDSTLRPKGSSRIKLDSDIVKQ